MSVDLGLALNILEKVGAPLVRAMLAVPSGAAAAASSAANDQARLLADLLEKSAHAGIALAGRMSLPTRSDEADSVRLALTGLAARLLGGFYRDSGRLPGEQEADRLLSTLEALLSFAGGFSGAADAADRLKSLDPMQAFALDESGIDALFLKAFVPVVNAVGAFSFGRADRRLVQDIAEHLTAEARRIAAHSPAAAQESDRGRRRRELAVLSALTDLYAECHKTQTRRLMTLDGAARAALAGENGGLLPMDPVWSAFASGVRMLEVLAGLPEETPAATSLSSPLPSSPSAPRQPSAPRLHVSITPIAAPSSPAPSPPAPTVPAPLAPVIPSAALPSAPETLRPDPDSGIPSSIGAAEANPMRFFKPGAKSS
jgi:hypothetical protein